MNLTNHRPHGCAQLLSHPTALPALAALLSSEFDGCERRGGLPRHFDTALMSLGLLTNVLEVRTAGGHPLFPTALPSSPRPFPTASFPLPLAGPPRRKAAHRRGARR